MIGALLTLDGCGQCSLRKDWDFLKNPRIPIIPPKIASDYRIVVLGEAPGRQEDELGVPFVGDTGQLLRNSMPPGWADKVYWGNIVRCRPPENRTPTELEVTCCTNYLEEDLARIQPHAILLIGGTALDYFWQGANISASRGVKFPSKMRNGSWVWCYSTFHPSYVARANRRDKPNPVQPLFQTDLAKFFAKVDSYLTPPNPPTPPTRQQVLYPKSLAEVQALFRRLPRRYGLDYETKNLKPYMPDARMLTAAYSGGGLTFAHPTEWSAATMMWGLPAWQWCMAQENVWVAHNSGFELAWTWAKAPTIKQRFEDTQALARVEYERKTHLALEYQSRIKLGVDIKSLTDVDVKNLANHRLEDVLYYNSLDAWCEDVMIDLYTLTPVQRTNYDRLIEGTRSTVVMELLGLDVDLNEAEELSISLGEKIDRYTQEARELPVVQEFERDNPGKVFSLGAPNDIGYVLEHYCGITLPKTEKKNYSTGEDVLQEFEGQHRVIDLTLDRREVTKLKSTYVTPVLNGKLLGVDRLLHPTYTTTLTATGRLSSMDPNIQNFPKRKHREVRRVVVAPKGMLLVSFDYGQLEARGFSWASADYNLRQSFLRKEDIHMKWLKRALALYPDYMGRLAEKSGEKLEKKILKAGRDTIKTDLVFASFYGSVAASVSQRTMIPMRFCDQLLYEFWQEYPTVLQWKEQIYQRYYTTGEIETLTGYVRNEVVSGNEPANNTIQGTGAHVVLEAQNAMYRIAEETGDIAFAPRINIHDDLSFLFPDNNDTEKYIELTAKEMIKPRFPFINCPILVEGKIGYNWADFEEIGTWEGEYFD